MAGGAHGPRGLDVGANHAMPTLDVGDGRAIDVGEQPEVDGAAATDAAGAVAIDFIPLDASGLVGANLDSSVSRRPNAANSDFLCTIEHQLDRSTGCLGQMRRGLTLDVGPELA